MTEETPSLGRLRQLVQMPYGDYLKTPEWKAKRDATVDRDGGRCRLCYSEENLQVHHRTYRRRGQEDLNDLTTLCKGCHENFHQKVTEQELHAKWGESYVPPTEEEQEREQKRYQEIMECNLLGLLLPFPEKCRETGIIRIVGLDDFTDLSRREIYRLLADGNAGTTFADWLPSHLHEEAKRCVAFAAENRAGDGEITNNDIVQYGGRFRVSILRKQNDGLEKMMNFADQAGDKEMVRTIRIGMANLLQQIREINTFIRSEYQEQRAKAEEKPSTWRERLAEIVKQREEGK